MKSKSSPLDSKYITNFVLSPYKVFLINNNMDLKLFDVKNIKTGERFSIRKCHYIGYASTIYSVDQATAILDHIGNITDSDDCLPFAISLIEGNQVIKLAEDNGEIGCGQILADCLEELKGYNVLICVSRQIDGAFVADMYQNQKLHIVKLAADNAIQKIGKVIQNNSSNSLILPIAEDQSEKSIFIDLPLIQTKTPKLITKTMFTSISFDGLDLSNNKNKYDVKIKKKI